MAPISRSAGLAALVVGLIAALPSIASSAIANLSPRLDAPENRSTVAVGASPNTDANWPTMSSDGRLIVFQSDDPTLVPGDTNRSTDVFVRNTETWALSRVSVSAKGKQGNKASVKPMISADGRYVVFESAATNLAGKDTNNARDIFVKDLTSGKVVRVSVSSRGAQGNGGSYWPQISGNGQVVAFESDATNLVPRDTNGVRDVFVRDLLTGVTSRASVSTTKSQTTAPSFHAQLSRAGDVLVFQSEDPNLDPAHPCDEELDECRSFLGYSVDLYMGSLHRLAFDTYSWDNNDAMEGSGVVLQGNGMQASSLWNRGNCCDYRTYQNHVVVPGDALASLPIPDDLALGSFPGEGERIGSYGVNYSGSAVALIWEDDLDEGGSEEKLTVYSSNTPDKVNVLGLETRPWSIASKAAVNRTLSEEWPAPIAINRSGTRVAFAFSSIQGDLDSDIYLWDIPTNTLKQVS